MHDLETEVTESSLTIYCKKYKNKICIILLLISVTIT